MHTAAPFLYLRYDGPSGISIRYVILSELARISRRRLPARHVIFVICTVHLIFEDNPSRHNCHLTAGKPLAADFHFASHLASPFLVEVGEAARPVLV